MKQKRIFNSKPTQYRTMYALLLTLSVLPLAAAYYLQKEFDLAPCPLCIAQRYAFITLAIFALFGLIIGRLQRWADGLAVLIGALGAGIAGYHLWILAHPSSECVKDSVEEWMNALPTARWFPDWFSASGSCTAHLPLVFGLQIPLWALIGLLGVSFVWMGFVVKRR